MPGHEQLFGIASPNGLGSFDEKIFNCGSVSPGSGQLLYFFMGIAELEGAAYGSEKGNK